MVTFVEWKRTNLRMLTRFVNRSMRDSIRGSNQTII